VKKSRPSQTKFCLRQTKSFLDKRSFVYGRQTFVPVKHPSFTSKRHLFPPAKFCLGQTKLRSRRKSFVSDKQNRVFENKSSFVADKISFALNKLSFA